MNNFLIEHNTHPYISLFDSKSWPIKNEKQMLVHLHSLYHSCFDLGSIISSSTWKQFLIHYDSIDTRLNVNISWVLIA